MDAVIESVYNRKQKHGLIHFLQVWFFIIALNAFSVIMASRDCRCESLRI